MSVGDRIERSRVNCDHFYLILQEIGGWKRALGWSILATDVAARNLRCRAGVFRSGLCPRHAARARPSTPADQAAYERGVAPPPRLHVPADDGALSTRASAVRPAAPGHSAARNPQ